MVDDPFASIFDTGEEEKEPQLGIIDVDWGKVEEAQPIVETPEPVQTEPVASQVTVPDVQITGQINDDIDWGEIERRLEEEERGTTTEELRENLFMTQHIDPDTRARALDVQEEDGEWQGIPFPVEQVEQDLGRFEHSNHTERVMSLDLDQAPVTKKTLADAIGGPAFRGDEADMVDTEKHHLSWWNRIRLGVEKGKVILQRGDQGWDYIFGDLEEGELEEIEKSTKRLQQISTSLGQAAVTDMKELLFQGMHDIVNAPSMTAEQFRLQGGMIADTFRSYAKEAQPAVGPSGPGREASKLAMSYMTSIAKVEAGNFRADLIGIKSDDGSPYPKEVGDGMALVYGWGAAGMEVATVPLTVGTYNQLKKMFPGLSKNEIKKKTKDMIKQAATDKRFRRLAGKIGVAAVAGGAGAGLEEMIQEAWGFLLEQDYRTRGGTLKEPVSTGFYKSVQAGWHGVLSGWGVQAAQTSPFIVLSEQQRVQRINENKEMSEFLAGKAGESQTIKRNNKRYHQYVKEVVKEYGGSENVTMPVEDFSNYIEEAGIDMEEIGKVSPETTENYTRALETGGEMEIPMGVYGEIFANDPKFANHVENARLHPELMTDAEVKDVKEKQAEVVKTIKQAKTMEGWQEAVDDFKDRLSDVGTPDIIEPYAEQLAAAHLVLSKEGQLSRDELETMFRLRVGQEDIEIAEMLASITAIQTDQVPTQRQIYGESLQEFVQEYDDPKGQEAFAEAVAAGYFNTTDPTAVTMDQFTSAVDQEDPVYAYGATNAQKLNRATRVAEVQRMAAAYGVNLLDGTPEQVLDRLSAERMERTVNRAGWVEKRVDSIVRELAYPDGRTKGYVAWVHPMDFVRATTGGPTSVQFIQEEAGDLDVEEIRGEQQTPFLYVDEEGNIVGHEGRHRMSALARSGITSVPVMVNYRSPADRAAQDEIQLSGQVFGGSQGESLTIRKAMPATWENKQQIQAEMMGDDRFLFQTRTVREGRETLEKFGLDPDKKYKKNQVALALQERQRELYGMIARNDRSDQAKETIAEWMAEEVDFELLDPENSGMGWYSHRFQAAIDIMGQVFPELLTDQLARNTMTALIAITSDGQAVMGNYAQAMEIYDSYRNTGSFSSERSHNRSASINNNLRILQQLFEEMGVEKTHEYLMQELPIKELKKIAKDRGGEMKSDYQVHIEMPMAAVEFGPKIGAFYSNLMGNHKYLTMDRWWTRTFNRYRGTILMSPTKTGLKRFRTLLGQPDLSDEATIAATIPYRDSYKAKNYKNGTEIETAANTIYKAAFEETIDAPFNAGDRTLMLEATALAQEKLKERGHDISIADIQAILWYYEKRLYGELGARKSADISYEEAAQKVVEGYADRRRKQPDDGRPAVGDQPEDQAVGEGEVRLFQGRPDSKTRPVLDLLRMGGRGTGKESLAFGRDPVEDGGSSGIRYRFTPSERLSTIVESWGTSPVSFNEITDGGSFRDAMVKAMAGNEFAGQVEIKEDYEGYRLFLSEDGSAGFAIAADGDIVSLFSTPGTTPKNFGYQAIALAIDQGGTKLDNYDTFLTAIYSRMGFVETDRYAWSDEYWDRETWDKETFKDFNNGEPDVVEMELRLEEPQRLEKEGEAGPLGYIDISPARDYFKITLTGRANLSTFLHESGHFYLEVITALADREGTSDRLKEDFETIKNWVGWQEGQTAFTTDQHEQFARGYEAYLMEGKAPSAELLSAFRRFSEWLKGIYTSIKSLDVELNDEIRGVFDRLLASDAAIAQMQELHDIAPAITDPAQVGMTPEQWEDYQAAHAEAMEEAEETMRLRLLKEIKAQKTKQYNNTKERVTEQVTDQVQNRPIYQALYFLKNGVLRDTNDVPPSLDKLDRAAVKALFYNDPKILNKMPRGITVKNGADPDLVANHFGYTSAHEMLNDFIGLKPEKTTIKETVDNVMDEIYGDSMEDPEIIATEAARALHNDKVAQFTTKELRLFSSKAKRPLPAGFVRQAQIMAEDQVSKLTVSELRSSFRYMQAEMRYAKEAAQAAAKNDWAAAADAKKKQLINHWMYRKAIKAKAEIDKGYTYLKKVQTSGQQARIGKAGGNYLESINRLLEGVELKKVSGRELARRAKKSLESLLNQIDSDGEVVLVEDQFKDESNLKNYAEYTFEEFRDLVAAVKNLDAIARKKLSIDTERGQIEFNAAVAALSAQIYRHTGVIKRSQKQNGSAWDKMKAGMRRYGSEMLKPEFLFQQLDGEMYGIAQELLFEPLAKAQKNYLDRQAKLQETLLAPFKRMSRDQKKRLSREYDFMGWDMKGYEILVLALNMGNQSNRTKMIEGYNRVENRGWTEENLIEKLEEILAPEDWDLVQHIWDELEQFWPEIEALADKHTGLKPPKIEPLSFKVGDKELRGGYYPVIYDPNRSQMADRIEAQKQNDMFERNHLRPNVSSGFKEARTAVTDPVLLEVEPLGAHFNEVLFYLTHYDAVNQINRLLRAPAIKQAFTDTVGLEYWKELQLWLQNIANQGKQATEDIHVERWADRLAVGTSIVSMAGGLSTSLIQLLGLTTTVGKLNPKWFVSGLVQAKRPSRWKFANENSQEMVHLLKTFDRDARKHVEQMLLDIAGKGRFQYMRGKAVQYGFAMIGGIQYYVSMVTWLGAYEKAVATMDMDQQQAALYADSIMRTTQTSGGMKDLARVQRRGGFTRMFTAFYGWFSALFGLLRSTGRETVRDPHIAAARIFAYVVLPVLVEKMWREGGPGDDEDWVDWIKDAGVDAVLFMTNTLPFIRDGISALATDYGYSFAPAGTILERGYYTLKKVPGVIEGDKEWTSYDTANVMKMVGLWYHFPVRPFTDGLKYLDAYLNGELEEPVRELFFGVKK